MLLSMLFFQFFINIDGEISFLLRFSLRKKYHASWEFKKRIKGVTAKHGLAYTIFSIWFRDNEIFSLHLEQEIMLETTFLKRFIICFHKSREGSYIRQNIENVRSSHGLLRRWKVRNFTKFKILLGGSRAGHQIWSMRGPEPILNFLSNHDLKNIYIANRDDWKSSERYNSTKSFVTARNADASFCLACANHRDDFELFSKSWKIHWISGSYRSFRGIFSRSYKDPFSKKVQKLLENILDP